MKDISKVITEILKNKDIDYDFASLQKESLADPEIQAFIAANQSKLLPDAVAKSAASIYEYVSQRDLIKNNLPSTLEGYTPNLIVNDGLIGVSYSPTKETIAAQKTLDTKRKISLMDFPETLQKADLEDFEPDEDRIEAYGRSLDVISKIINHDSTKGLYFSGNFGVGKSYLMAAIANSLAQSDFSVILIHVPTFISGLTAHFADNSVNAQIKKLMNVDVLMLDDIGAETLSAWVRDDVLGVIFQARMENLRPTFFTSNLRMDDLEKHLAETKNGTENFKAKRVMERIRFLADEVEVGGKNRRHN